jgi:hypothetical protein
MGEPTFWEKITLPFERVLYKIEYFFAKRWLDNNFGEVDYWGDYLYEKLKGYNPDRNSEAKDLYQ